MIITPIKYHLLKPPFLLEGSTATEFIYKIQSLSSDKEVDIYSYNLKFEGCRSRIFTNNLMMIDSKMPQLLSEIILISYSHDLNNLKDILNELEKSDPLEYKNFNSVKIYNNRISEFLKSLALGLNSTNIWHGEPNLYEHFPILKHCNELVYYSDGIKTFIDILIEHSELEIKIKSPTIISDENYLNLRLQINLKT